MKVTLTIADLEAAIEKAKYADPAYEPGRSASSIKTLDLDITGAAPISTVAAEVVIVNCKNREWVSRLIYTLEKAGLMLREDYMADNKIDRTIVFSEK